MMSGDAWLVCWMAGMASIGVLSVMARRLSRDARIRRRLRKSNSRIISKTSRPMVKFSVRTPKK